MKRPSVKPTLGALALAAISFAASAANVATNQNITTTSGASWQVINTGGTDGGAFGGSCNSSSGLAISDASFGGHGDAYDNGWEVFVNGAIYSTANMDLTGTTMTGPVVNLSGLNVTTQYYFAPNSAVVRVLVTLSNPGEGTAAATVQVPINFGSDGGSIFQATSSGNATVENADRWIISSDGGPSDPVLTNVFYGPGAPAETPTYTTTVFNCAASNGIGATFNLDVPAGGTQSLLFFGGLNGITTSTNTVAAAQTAAAVFNSNATIPAEWLQGMSQTQINQVVNWNPAGLVGAPSQTCASSGYTGTQLLWCQNICEKGYTGATLDMWIRRWLGRWRDLPYCAVETPPPPPPPQGD